MRRKQEFGGFRVTPETLWKPPLGRAFRPRYKVPAEVHERLRDVERLDEGLRSIPPDPATARRVLRDALTRNAFGTASIEGNPLTLDEVESLLARSPTAGAVQPDEREILNWAHFMEGLDGETFPTDADGVVALHGRLFAGVLDDAGRLKTQPNFVGRHADRTVVFVPTAPEDTPRALQQALDWLLRADENPLVRAMVFFHEFQGIHPFRDGNGRLGRALFTLFLHTHGYPGVRYALIDYEFNRARTTYYEALAEVERRGWDFTPWLLHMSDVLQRTYRDAVQRFAFAQPPAGLNDRQLRVAEWFALLGRAARGQPVKVADVHAAFPHVPRRTLQHDLARLVAAGLLDRRGERKGTTYRFRG